VDSIGQNDLGFTDSGSSIDLATPNMAGMRGWISGVWSANASWLEGTAPTTSADKAWFDSAVSGGAGGTVTLDLPVVLSSMLFKTSSTGYTIAPATAADTITLSSSIAADAQIQSLSGDNVIAANIITTTGDPIIGVSPGIKLTNTAAISGPGTLSVNGLGNGASVTPTNGILALQGANTFTGPVIMTGYGRLEVNQFVASTSTPSPLGQSGPDAANLVIQGTLAYTGTTDATTNRGFTLSGNGVLNQIEVPASTNLTITGQVVGNTQSTALRKIGDGTLTLANSGTGNTLPTAQLVVSTGKLVFENGTYTKNISAGLAFLKTDGWPDWDGEGGIYVGKNGTSAEVVIQNGATVVNQGETWLGYMNNSQGSITINDTGTLTANNSVHLGVYYNGSDAAPAPKGTITLNGSAKLNVNGGNLTVGQWAEGHLNVHGSAQVAVVNDMVVGDNWGDNPVTQQSNGNVTIDSATASIGVSRRILIGWSGGTGHWNQDAGQTTANSGVVIGNAYDVGSEGDGFLNLNGGVFTTPSIVTGATLGGSPAATVATVNLNGGTLKATRNNSDYLANATGATFSANVLKNATTGLGAVIDTNGYNVGINRALTHGGVVTDGGVTKIGAGALTLANAANTFDGGTNIVAGKVVSDMPGALGTGAVNFTGANTTLSVGYSAPVSSVGTFSASGSNWNLGGNGPASISGDTLTITTNNGDLANSAIYNRKVSTQDFTASFTYLDATGGGADGFTFLLQTNGQSAVGGGGGGLGYSGVINSVALEGNVYGGSGIRIAQNGATGGYTAPGTVDLTSNANPTTFTLVYHTSTDTLDVTLDQPGLAANYTTSYAGIGLAGLGDVYVGFTGGTGGLSAQQNISNFSYSAGASTAPLASTVYGNALTVAAGISANVNVLASAAQPTVTMGNLALASGSALNVAAEVGTPADLAYGLTLGSATLAGPATLAVADNGAGLGTLTLASVAGTGSLTKTGAGSLDVVGSIAMAGDTIVNQGTVNATGGINTPANAVYVSTGTTLNASSIVADSLTIGGGPYAAAATASVPEPCTFVLLALAGLGALLVWRRK
jgi:autotransporter-associated beta strand protein